jgi:D-sedoheptulose 7-phosphate isomerase
LGANRAGVLCRGGRLLVAGNGGSAAEAQHLTAELVGKLRSDQGPWAFTGPAPNPLTALCHDVPATEHLREGTSWLGGTAVRPGVAV